MNFEYSELLQKNKPFLNQIYLNVRLNELETEDDYLQFGQNTHEREFYDVKSTISRPMSLITEDNKKTLGSAKLIFSTESLKHERKIFAFFDLIGSIGGVLEVTMIVFGLIFVPISEHIFVKAAAK